MYGQYKSGSLSLTANSEDLIDFMNLIQKVDSPKKLVQIQCFIQTIRDFIHLSIVLFKS